MKNKTRRTLRRWMGLVAVVAGALMLWSALSAAQVSDGQTTVAYAAELPARLGVSYYNHIDDYFAVDVPYGWVVSDGRSDIEVSSPTGAVRYEYGYAYGGVVGTYTLARLTSLAIGTLQLQGARLLQGPTTTQLGRGWSLQTTVVQGYRSGQLVYAIARVQLIDNAYGEGIIAETMSAPASQWRTDLPILLTISKSLRVMVGDECARLGVGCYQVPNIRPIPRH